MQDRVCANIYFIPSVTRAYVEPNDVVKKIWSDLETKWPINTYTSPLAIKHEEHAQPKSS